MSQGLTFKKFAGWSSVLLALVIWAAIALLLKPIGWDFSRFANPEAVLSVGSEGAKHIEYAWILDLFWYLLHVPIALFFWQWLRRKNPAFVDLYTAGAFLYAAIGAVTTGFLWKHWPALIHEYAQADATQRETIKLLYTTVAMSAQGGMYGVEMVPGGVWFLGIGDVLRTELGWRCKALGAIAMILGISMLLMFLLEVFGIYLSNSWFTAIYLHVTPFWALGLGVHLLMSSDSEFVNR
jgi:hypothetical protein